MKKEGGWHPIFAGHFAHFAHFVPSSPLCGGVVFLSLKYITMDSERAVTIATATTFNNQSDPLEQIKW
jgi:hypothetical protein